MTKETMTKEQLAARLTGREYGDEITKQESDEAKKHGLLVVYGASDDLVEFSGYFCDEDGAWNGTVSRVDRKGLLKKREQIDDDDDEELKDFFKREPNAAKIEALWCKEPGYSWT